MGVPVTGNARKRRCGGVAGIGRSFATPLVPIAFLCLLLADRSGLCAVTLLAAAVHEGGHLLAARLLGVRIRGFRLDFSGARLHIGGRALSFGEEWLLSAAGPLASLIASGLVSPLWQASHFFGWFSCASLLLGLFNLLPIRTLDGGRMLSALLYRISTPTVAFYTVFATSAACLFFLWTVAVYLLLRAGDGLSLFFLFTELFIRFFDASEET